MKMISQQTISKRICDGRDVLFIQLHEVIIIAFLDEDILAVVAAIIDVIVGVVQ